MKNTSPLATIKQPLVLRGLIAVSLMLTPMAALAQKQKPSLPAYESYTNAYATGPIAGGGGYVTENSLELLKRSRDLLVSQLRNASDVVFTGLPAGWTRERLIKVIANIRISAKKPPMERDGIHLEFNYDRDQNGEYIEARRTFFETHAAAKVNYGDRMELEAMYLEVQLKMLHETAHLMNIGTTAETNDYAKAFGKEVIRRLQENYVVCSFPKNKLASDAIQKIFPYDSNLSVDTWIVANLTGHSSISFFQSSGPLESRLRDAVRLYTQGENSVSARLHTAVDRLIKKWKKPTFIQEGAFFALHEEDDEINELVTVTPAPQIRVNPVRNQSPYAADLSLINKNLHAELNVAGVCRSLAKPIQFDYAKARGAK